MVAVVCRHCGSEALVKCGLGSNGKQRYKCNACGRRSRESPQGQGHSEAFKEQILAAYDERMSQRGIQRAFGVSRQSLSAWLKKDQKLLEEQRQTKTAYLATTLVEAQEDDVLELDEVWAFVGNKKNQVWIWLALCRRTRQVVAWHYGPRDEVSCQFVWEKVPKEYKTKMCYSDLWHSYSKVIPKDQHQACAKQEGQTNHVERFNLTLRQRVSRLVRKTLSYSKNLLCLIRHMRLFLVRYNLERKRRLTRP